MLMCETGSLPLSSISQGLHKSGGNRCDKLTCKAGYQQALKSHFLPLTELHTKLELYFFAMVMYLLLMLKAWYPTIWCYYFVLTKIAKGSFFSFLGHSREDWPSKGHYSRASGQWQNWCRRKSISRSNIPTLCSKVYGKSRSPDFRVWWKGLRLLV